MKPLAIFAGIAVVGLAVIAAGLHLTDHSASANPSPAAPTPLTHAQFVREGNRVCARFYREDMPIFKRPAKTLKMLKRDLRRLLPASEREAAGLRALVPPRSDARTYQRLLRRVAQALHYAHASVHAFETGQIRRGVLIGRQGGRLEKPLNSLSRKVGLTVCGLTRRQALARYG